MDLVKNLSDRKWRLENLYRIIGKDGKEVLFKPNESQKKLLNNLHLLSLILKARQLGFTTFIQILMLDSALFTPNTHVGTIAHKLDAAKKIFKEKVKFPYDKLPDEIKAMIPLVSDSERQMEFGNGSSFFVDSSLRGGTYQMLHVSEYGKMCAKDPERAEEVKTGAFNTVHAGQMIFVESTAEGRAGHFYDLCKGHWDIKPENLTPLDFRFYFFPWWEDPGYVLEGDVLIPQTMREYFQKLEDEHSIILTKEQKNWYVKKSAQQGDHMKREFPSYPKEAFEQAVEGAYFAPQMAQLRNKGRIRNVPHDPSYPVDTFWDIGMSDYTSIWFFQRIGTENRFIDYYQNCGEGPSHYVNVLEGRGKHNGGEKYNYGTHHLPHDAGNQRFEGCIEDRLNDLGVRNTSVGPRARDKNDPIAAARLKLPTCYFDEANCDKGLKCLDLYRKRWNDKTGVWSDQPLHDEASHGADAFMVWATDYHGPVNRMPIKYSKVRKYA